MALEDVVRAVQRNLRLGNCRNEATVREVLVSPILAELDWPVLDPTVVAREYALESRRVDYALFTSKKSPEILIEVKAIGNSLGADRQLFEYAFHQGVPFAILTDGREWIFYLPQERGDYAERRLYKLDLSERGDAEASEILIRYLQFSRVKSGVALTDAQSDYRGAARKREAAQALPQAWRELIADPVARLIDLLSEKVQGICGVAPTELQIVEFLGKVAAPEAAEPIPKPAPRKPIGGFPIPSPTLPGGRRISYVFRNVSHSARDTIDAMVQILKLLHKEKPDLFSELKFRVKGRSRNHIANRRDEVYPSRPDLAVYVREVVPGWFVGTNIAGREKRKILEHACDVAGLEFGRDVKIDLND